MALSNKEIAQQLLVIVGGKENIKSVKNCMTRLHLELEDQSKVDRVSLDNLEGVLGVVEDEVYQVIFGPGKVERIHDEFKNQLNKSGSAKEGNRKASQVAKQKTPIQKFLESFVSVFIPLLPIMLVSLGLNILIKVINTYTSFSLVEVWAYQGLMIIAWLIFVLFTVLAGRNASVEFGGSKGIGSLIGLISVVVCVVPIFTKIGTLGINVGLLLNESIFSIQVGGLLLAVIVSIVAGTVQGKSNNH